MKVYNTLTKSIEEFVPFDPPIVRMYVCGPTVYDETHVGHGRTFSVFDSLKRYLEEKGYIVLHVQNITDIDDKIIKRSQEEGTDWKTIADKYTESYLEILKRLDIRPTINPKVTEHIEDIIKLIEILLARGNAYVRDGNVYFNVTTYPDYGKLSKIPRESWRQEEEYLSEKINPADFALWKKMKPDEPYWVSPWGYGRPGWHIECSAMSSKYLGAKIDIHAGGNDLIFPHHENERAQSECAFNVSPWVKYWMHSGMVTIRGEKMSKSLGNIIEIRELLDKYTPETLRVWYLSAHYRSPLDFSEETLYQYDKIRERLSYTYYMAKKALDSVDIKHSLTEDEIELLRGLQEAISNYYHSMDDDFNTSQAMSYIHHAVSIFWKSTYSRESYPLIFMSYIFLQKVNNVFRFQIQETRAIPKIEEDLIKVLIDVRRKLREQRLYILADEIRKKLHELGIELYDKGLETEYRVIK